MGGALTLREDPLFGRLDFSVNRAAVDQLLKPVLQSIPRQDWFFLGYAVPDGIFDEGVPTRMASRPVDNFFRLFDECGFEQLPAVITLGLRASRFAPILFWEAFHALAPGGLWLDLDYDDRCKGSPLCDADYLEREYYRDAFEVIAEERTGRYRIRLARKTLPSMLSSSIGDSGWTFGILTAGPSPHAARMVREILALDIPEKEVIICGPAPAGLPSDSRVRQIDLDRPEPRGWISRKKNMIAAVAEHENLCLFHDRFFLPRRFAMALRRYGPVFSFVTFPQVYFPDSAGECISRYPDYQVVKGVPTESLRATFITKIYDGEFIFHPRYDDFHETAFCCGGIYLAKKQLWNLVPQDEGLYHCEWEDILFGLDCQRKGMPHRVNPYACFESVSPHPTLLTSLHVLDPAGKLRRGTSHISARHRLIVKSKPEQMRPVMRVTRAAYCSKLAARFNALPFADRAGPFREGDLDGQKGLSGIWMAVYERISRVQPQSRAEIYGVFAMMSDLIYNFASCVLQGWTRDTERFFSGAVATNSRNMFWLVQYAFSFSVRKLMSKGWDYARHFLSGRARLTGSGAYAPLLSLISYFRSVEEVYPAIFVDDLTTKWKDRDGATVPDQAQILQSKEVFKTVFLRHAEGLLPLLDGWGDDEKCDS